MAQLACFARRWKWADNDDREVGPLSSWNWMWQRTSWIQRAVSQLDNPITDSHCKGLIKGVILLYVHDSACLILLWAACQSPKVLKLNSSACLLPAGWTLPKPQLPRTQTLWQDAIATNRDRERNLRVAIACVLWPPWKFKFLKTLNI